MKEIMLCAENEKHVGEISPDFIKDLRFTYVKTMEDVLENAIGKIKSKDKARQPQKG
jgi:ATP-dependent Lon protease